MHEAVRCGGLCHGRNVSQVSRPMLTWRRSNQTAVWWNVTVINYGKNHTRVFLFKQQVQAARDVSLESGLSDKQPASFNQMMWFHEAASCRLAVAFHANTENDSQQLFKFNSTDWKFLRSPLTAWFISLIAGDAFQSCSIVSLQINWIKSS